MQLRGLRKISNMSYLPWCIDQDQTASEEAVWSGSSLFAIEYRCLLFWIPDMTWDEKEKMFEILERMPYAYLY